MNNAYILISVHELVMWHSPVVNQYQCQCSLCNLFIYSGQCWRMDLFHSTHFDLSQYENHGWKWWWLISKLQWASMYSARVSTNWNAAIINVRKYTCFPTMTSQMPAVKKVYWTHCLGFTVALTSLTCTYCFFDLFWSLILTREIKHSVSLHNPVCHVKPIHCNTQ